MKNHPTQLLGERPRYERIPAGHREMSAVQSSQMSPAEQWFVGWTVLIGLGLLLGGIREISGPGSWDVWVESTRFICWHLGLIGVVMTAGALALSRRLGRKGAVRWVQRANLTWLKILLALVIGFSTGEVFLRVVFHDGASFSDDHGPIVRRFTRYYAQNRFRSRGPDTAGPKAVGRVRLMMQGDSITFGQGVKDSQDIYPSILLDALNRAVPGRFEMAMLAHSGAEIDAHLQQLRTLGTLIDPDLIIYQWYANDMELDKTLRPKVRGRFWRTWALHGWLYEHSYAWWFLDNRVSELLYGHATPYHVYLNQTFSPDSPHWKQFEMLFQSWAGEAKALSPRVLLLLYPWPGLSLGDAYELRDIHERVIALAAANGIESLDFIQSLRDVKSWRETYVSRFEAHPNARTHQRMADTLLKRIRTTWPELFQAEVR